MRGLIDRRLDGISAARLALIEAKRQLQQDGVGPNGRDGWPPDRVAKWHAWYRHLDEMDREMCDEAIAVDMAADPL